MRTNIDIDDAVLEAAMKAGAFKTKKEAVEAGLKAIARQAHYRELLRWEGQLHWDGDALDQAAWPAQPPAPAQAQGITVQEPQPPAVAANTTSNAKANAKPKASRGLRRKR